MLPLVTSTSGTDQTKLTPILHYIITQFCLISVLVLADIVPAKTPKSTKYRKIVLFTMIFISLSNKILLYRFHFKKYIMRS